MPVRTHPAHDGLSSPQAGFDLNVRPARIRGGQVEQLYLGAIGVPVVFVGTSRDDAIHDRSRSAAH